ncbi:class I SAM-dependent methyltransferase [Brucepastera parasyntrophica]|uniref:class I SAM-dependent methyltransferase n=1 Tax=Brucepastera parasyntrophica TaxID=2880008 RepID=UPI0021095A4E|nr:class I SAM-dependent methyltransferase [Brucepastera parasyntrophica]ULQ59907.1 class I SAM-dependent methyltransferase [Brucepastera parasyntrophica]
MTLVSYLRNEKTKNRIVALITECISYFRSISSREDLQYFSASVYNWFFRECMVKNQYVIFSENQYAEIKKLYEKLVFDLKKKADERAHIPVEKIVSLHRNSLIGILGHSGGSAAPSPAICSEYTLDLQEKILHLQISFLAEPILDIGCGEQALLTKELRKNNKTVIGIDQFFHSDAADYLLCKNWLEFEYQSCSWGSIVSHMAFSNHFIHHLSGQTGMAGKYEEVFFAILDSLKPGGTFYYAPAIPSIENKVDTEKYSIKRYETVYNAQVFSVTHIRKCI